MKVTCYDLWTTRTLVSKIFHVVVLDIEFLRVVVFLDSMLPLMFVSYFCRLDGEM
jgi:hypothetical protein